MAVTVQKGIRPSIHAEPRYIKRRRPVGVDKMASRYERGLDLWSGEPLEGENARQWLRIFFGVAEDVYWAHTVRRIDLVNGDTVHVTVANGQRRVLNRGKILRGA